MRKKKPVPKVKPVSQRKESTNKLIYEEPTLSFHETFPLTLKHFEGKEEKVCYFQCQQHLEKYVLRNKLKTKDYRATKTQPKMKNILELLDEL